MLLIVLNEKNIFLLLHLWHYSQYDNEEYNNVDDVTDDDNTDDRMNERINE